MKRLVLIIAAIAAFAFSSFAQLTASDSRGISIQGIARDNNGGIYASAAITILITVNNGSSVVYQEQQTGIMTDVAGVFSTNIGIAPGGPNTLTVMKGTSFSAVDFNVGSLSVQVQVQVNSGALVTVGTFALQMPLMPQMLIMLLMPQQLLMQLMGYPLEPLLHMQEIYMQCLDRWHLVLQVIIGFIVMVV